MTNNTTAEVSEAMIEAERWARVIRRSRFERTGRLAAYDDTLPLNENELTDGAAVALAMQSERLKGDGEVERLLELIDAEINRRAGVPLSCWQREAISAALSPPSDGVSR